MEIRHLEAYPACFQSDHSPKSYGISFPDITRICHLQYDGLTVGPNREEINSLVVLDMKLAFEGVSDATDAYIDRPQFYSPDSLRMDHPPNVDFFDVTVAKDCLQKWCLSHMCNYYYMSQQRKRSKIGSAVTLVLEELELEKQRGKEGIDRI
ncbi:hypothetical protein B0H66DRAFT_539967 [Apodospora peruviana]|uniref:Uncharacterized protein n=1 Tax=Apodospora peruviana TaxID=516989 RepID=A0AAE0MDX6_9PEZI|nr:hypothetical protein B0H66DRAFT_539967 [Apodospora peruviana]